MKNREQIAFSVGFTEYSDEEAVEQIAAMLEAAGVAFLGREERERLAQWMGLDCDSGNNWGVLHEED